MADDAHENLDERLLHRMLFFTDAVFAIVLTLLVLELRPPAGEMAEQLRQFGEMGRKLMAFAGSFALIGVFWFAHMNITRQLARFDWPVAGLNLLFLFPVCLIPFASAWVGEGLGQVSWSFYCASIIATSLFSVLLVLAATRGGGRLMVGAVGSKDRLYRASRAAVPAVAFAVSMAAVWLRIYPLAWHAWIVIPILFVLIGRFLKPKPAPEAVPEPAAA